MLYRVLADGVVLLHLTFIAFVVLGGFFAHRRRWVPWLHVPAVSWAVALELRGWICPLTPLEGWLRCAGDAPFYSGGFIEHYIVPVVYPPGLTRETQILLGLLVILINGLAYGRLLWRRARSAG